MSIPAGSQRGVSFLEEKAELKGNRNMTTMLTLMKNHPLFLIWLLPVIHFNA